MSYTPDWRDRLVHRRENMRLNQLRPIDLEQAKWARSVERFCLNALLAGGIALCMISWLWK